MHLNRYTLPAPWATSNEEIVAGMVLDCSRLLGARALAVALEGRSPAAWEVV